MDQVTVPSASPAAPQAPAKGFQFSWDTFFTFVLLILVLLAAIFMFKSPPETNPEQCTPDGQPSTGTQGSDCCSTNGVDANGSCMPRGPMGSPAYGIQNSSTPQEFAMSPVPAPEPAAIPTPPVPNVSTGSTQPTGFPPSIWNDNGNPPPGSPAPV